MRPQTLLNLSYLSTQLTGGLGVQSTPNCRRTTRGCSWSSSAAVRPRSVAFGARRRTLTLVCEHVRPRVRVKIAMRTQQELDLRFQLPRTLLGASLARLLIVFIGEHPIGTGRGTLSAAIVLVAAVIVSSFSLSSASSASSAATTSPDHEIA